MKVCRPRPGLSLSGLLILMGGDGYYDEVRVPLDEWLRLRAEMAGCQCYTREYEVDADGHVSIVKSPRVEDCKDLSVAGVPLLVEGE